MFACLAMLVSYLPFSEINASVARLADAIGAGVGATAWIGDAYAVALAAVVLPAGAFSARLGARRTTTAGLVACVVGSVIVAVAGAVPVMAVLLLLSGAAVCGVGGGLVMSSSLALINATAAGEGERARGVALWAAALVTGLAVGPFLAAVVLGVAAWFALALPAALLAAAVIAFGIRVTETATNPARIDVSGSVLAAGAALGLVGGTVGGGAYGWYSVASLLPLGAGLVLLVALVLVERHQHTGLLRMELFTSKGFDAAAAAAAAALFTMVGIVVVLGVALDSAGVDALGVASRLLALFGANAVASILAPGVTARLGQQRVLATGLIVAAAGATLLALTGTHLTAVLVATLAVIGLGCGLVMATASAVAISAVAADAADGLRLAAMAGATNNALRQLGAALGPAVMGTLLAAAHNPTMIESAAHRAASIAAGVLAAAATVIVALSRRTSA